MSFFFFNDTATTEIYTLSLHDALPILQVAVLLDEGVDGLVLHGVDHGDQVVDAPGVHRHAEADLGLDLVALGHRDVAHVVAEAGQPQRPGGRRSGGRPRPRADPGPHPRTGHVAGDR